MLIPQPSYRNSAGRLLSILGAIPPNLSILESIPKAFGISTTVQEEKQQACIMGLAELHRVYLEFVLDINDAKISEDQRNVVLEGLASLRQSVYPTNLGNSVRAPTDAEKALLKVAATVIPQEAAIDDDDIEKIRESIASLRKLVENAEISPTMRKVLLDLIRLSEDAISRFNVHGARGLRKAFKAMLGEVAEIYGTAATTEQQAEVKKSPAWQAIMKHLRLIDAVAAKVLQYQPLIVGAAQLLLGGPAS